MVDNDTTRPRSTKHCRFCANRYRASKPPMLCAMMCTSPWGKRLLICSASFCARSFTAPATGTFGKTHRGTCGEGLESNSLQQSFEEKEIRWQKRGSFRLLCLRISIKGMCADGLIKLHKKPNTRLD